MSDDVCAKGVRYIDAQLLALRAHAILLAPWIEHGEQQPRVVQDDQSWPALENASQRMRFVSNVPCANAIVAVANFFDLHRLSASRAPEVQFLLRLRDAALNGNTFSIAQGEHAPHASFGGISIDEKLDGHALFDDGTRAGVIAHDDVTALLRDLRKLLRGMQTIVSAGDAG